ncbi:DEAD/DEAH box helicase family protein [Leifsonia sp. 2MCAF36]|uniref:DEAD/DEAH box helicase family protein n=1 Tax=Leifsonia sp. 2MCAF36 TaxID=3232988 RepID=UPI003F9C652A
MSNFAFVRETLPELHAECAHAESYLTTDPRSACFYSRRAVEQLVDYLYDVMGLNLPYRDDLAAKTNDPAFKAKAGLGIVSKLNLVRRLGNDAVHKAAPPSARDALGALREVFHLMVWAGLHYSAHPDTVPTGAQFDPELAAKAAPLTRDQVRQLAAKFRQQDEAHAKALAQRDELAAGKDAEIEALKAQITAAQAAAKPDDHDYDEAATRDLFIDLLLREAGWRVLGPEVPGPFSDAVSVEYQVIPMPNPQGFGFADYVVWGADGLPLAVVEAKRTRKSAQAGQRQAELYADALEAMTGRRPVIYYTNGYEHWLWDDAAGYPPRAVSGFMTRDELELTVQRRRTRLALSSATVDHAIVERPYQVRAIKAVGGAFDARERSALLVMATGSGKTRTVIALVKQLQERGWVKRALFLADRTALVKQAARAFREHLPGSTTVDLVTERTAEGRVYVSTYPTMMNLIDEVDDRGRRFGPGYFDLIVVDEAHRSIYAKYGAIFRYFDAMLVGLTATPKDEVDHNTYRLFHLENGVPTDAYGLDEAVRDGYLMPPRAIAVPTKFMRQGIRYDDLTEDEKDQWDSADWGDDGLIPSEIGAAELNSFLYNDDTIDKVLETLMTRGYRVEGGDRLGKTIIFAANQRHAERIQERFDLAYPEAAGKSARIITYQSSYAQSLIDDFSQPSKHPDIAISVDMLDTGIDVPEVLNLVFFKAVRSKAKFWQMIGRGTRLAPDVFGPGQDKQDFLVFDFCGNLEFFSQNLPGAEGQVQASLSQRIFEARVALVGVVGNVDAQLQAATASGLSKTIAGMNLDNFIVRPHRMAVERFASVDAWDGLSGDDAELAASLAGLPSSVRDSDEMAKRLDLLILRRQLAQLEGDQSHADRLRLTVQDIAARLLTKTAIPSVLEQAVLLEEVAGDEWWVDVTVGMLELARLRLRGLMRFLEPSRRDPVYVDLEDVLGEATEIALPGVTPGMDFDRFRSKAQAYLRAHEDHVALQRLRRGRPLTETDLLALQTMLADAGGNEADISRAEAETGGLAAFIRSLIGLDRDYVRSAFERYLDGTAFTAEQIRFVALIVDELTRNGRMDPGRLYESPYTDNAPAGPDSLFPALDVDEIVSILRRMNGNGETEVA